MKKFLSVLLIIGMIFSLSACGEKTSQDKVSDSKATTEKSIKSAKTLEELEQIVSADVDETVENLNIKLKEVLAENDTYEKYLENISDVEAFYVNILNDTELLCIRLQEYSIAYAEMILKSDKDFSEKYDDFDELYDVIYEDARDEIYDEIYDGILDEMYDAFYDGIMDDAYDNMPYEKWSDMRSNEYDLWSDTRSDVYDIWSDASSDIYDFWSDMRSEMYDKDIEKANKKLSDFKEDIEALYVKSSEEPENKEDTKTKDNAEETKLENEETTTEETSSNNKEWKAFLDDYSEWVDEYVKITKKYSENPTDMSILSDYTDTLTELTEWKEKSDDVAEELEEASPSEVAEYTSELLKITAKIAEAAY